MVNKLSLFFLISVLMIWKICPMSAQNLVPNPNFEFFSSCPDGVSQLTRAVPWISPTTGSPDYFNACASSFAVGVPSHFGGAGYQFAFTGNGYVGCYLKFGNQIREYIQVKLSAPLEFGKCYQVGFFLNLSNQYCGVNQGGIYISDVAPFSLGNGILPFEPQIEGNGGYYSDTVTWVEISGLYPAHGGEQFITIGNFKDDPVTMFDPLCTGPTTSYYYII